MMSNIARAATKVVRQVLILIVPQRAILLLVDSIGLHSFDFENHWS